MSDMSGDPPQQPDNDRPPTAPPREMSAEDKWAVLKLYQKNPLLWADFRKIIDFIDLMDETPRSYELLLRGLKDINLNRDSPVQAQNFEERIKLAVAVGFVARCSQLYCQIRTELNIDYMDDLKGDGVEMALLSCLHVSFMNMSCYDHGLCQRLVQTGILQTMMNDVRHMQHLAADVLESGRAFYRCVGTLINCLRHPDLTPAIRDMGAVDCVTPFMAKTTACVRALALYALCCLANDCEVTRLQLDEAVFSFLLDKAGKRRNGQECDWALEEVFFVLASTSRSQSNRQLMANTEFFKLMADVLPRTEEYIEKHALTILTELAKESDRFRNITGAASLIRVLKRLRSNYNDQASQKITAVLVALAGKDGDGEDALDSRPHLRDLLADKVNVLSILGIGEVEFVLDHLHHLCSQGSRCCTSDYSTDHTDHTLLQGLQALAELALEEEDTKKEIVDKGGLETVRSCMQEDGQDTVQRQALMVLLALTASTHCCKKMKTHDDLLKTVEQCRQSTSPDLSEMAEQILTCLGRHTV